MHFTIALLLFSVPPEAPATIIVTGAALDKPAEEKKICRAGAATGTRITKHICKTLVEWEALESKHFNKMDAVSNNGRSGVK